MKEAPKKPLMSSLLSKINTPPVTEKPVGGSVVLEPETIAVHTSAPASIQKPAPQKPAPAFKQAKPAAAVNSRERSLPQDSSRKTDREAELINGAKKSSRVVDFIHNKLKHISTDTGVPFSILVNRILNEYVTKNQGKPKPQVPLPY